MSLQSTTKRCSRCTEYKALDLFRKNRQKRDGKHPHCKDCERAYQQAKACTKVVTERYCPSCKHTLPAQAFAKNKNTQDGLMRYCKTCDGINSSSFRATHKDYIKQHKAAYQVAHVDSIRVAKQRNYQANRVKIDAKNRAWAAANRASVRSGGAAWKKRNPMSVREGRMRYNARKVAATIEQVDYNLILQRDGCICHICGDLVAPDAIHFDHVIPLSKGGAHSYDNIKVSHAFCNLSKHNRLL